MGRKEGVGTDRYGGFPIPFKFCVPSYYIRRKDDIVWTSVISAWHWSLICHDADPQPRHKISCRLTCAKCIGVLIRFTNDAFIKPTQPLGISMTKDDLAAHVLVVIRC